MTGSTTRPTHLTIAIILNGLLWGLAVFIYVFILTMQVPPESAEHVSNMVSAANLLRLWLHFYGLVRLWRAPTDLRVIRLALVTNVISAFYSVQCPLQTVLRFVFLEPGTTEATLAVVAADVIGSFGFGGITSFIIVRYCLTRLQGPPTASPDPGAATVGTGLQEHLVLDDVCS
jgi:hypothetical protein